MSFGTSKLVVEVVFEGELHLVVVKDEAIEEVRPAAPLELAAHHYVLGGVMKQIDQPVLAAMKAGRRLQNLIVDIHQRVAAARAPAIAPVAVIDSHHAKARQG